MKFFEQVACRKLRGLGLMKVACREWGYHYRYALYFEEHNCITAYGQTGMG
jgi:hypothetical protein